MHDTPGAMPHHEGEDISGGRCAAPGGAAPLRLGPAYLAVLACVCALSFWLMHPVPLLGDESYYAQASAHLARALRSAAALDFSELVPALKTLRGGGWFMPGMPVLLLPATLLFGGEAPVWALRLCPLAANALLLALVGRALRRRLGERAALLFLGVTLLSPYCAAYLSALWGDIVGTLLVLLFVLWCDGRLSAGREIPALKAGALLAGIVYVRSLFLPLLAVYSAAVLLAALRRDGLTAAAGGRWARQTLAACAVFFALLAPWSYWQSARYGFVLTTTSVPLSQLILFGDPASSPELRAGTGFSAVHNALNRKSFGGEAVELRRAKAAAGKGGAAGTAADLAPTGTGAARGAGALRTADRAERLQRSAARRVARATGSYMDHARAARDAALRGLTPRQIVERLGANVDAYYLDPAGRLFDFVLERFGPRVALDSVAANALFLWATLWWFAVLLFGAAALVLPFDVGPQGYVPGLFHKALVFVVGLHPFYVFAHARYHVQLFPVVGVLAAFLATGRFTIYGRASRRGDPAGLVGAGQGLAAVFAIVTFAMLVAF